MRHNHVLVCRDFGAITGRMESRGLHCVRGSVRRGLRGYPEQQGRPHSVEVRRLPLSPADALPSVHIVWMITKV